MRNYESEGREGHRPRIGAVLLLLSCWALLECPLSCLQVITGQKPLLTFLELEEPKSGP